MQGGDVILATGRTCRLNHRLSHATSLRQRHEDTGSDIYNLNRVDFSAEQCQFCVTVSQHVSTGPVAFIQLSVPVHNQCFTVSEGLDDSDWALEQKQSCER